MSTTKKRQIVVVKNLKESTSPKRQLLVSRKPLTSDGEGTLEPSHLGNTSPTHSMRSKDGNVVSRSILGDPAVYDNVEKQQSSNTGDAATRRSSRGISSPLRASTMMTSFVPATATIAEDPKSAYFSTLREKTIAASKARTKDISMGETLSAYLPMKERFALAKEKNVLTLWQQRQQEWERIQNHISSAVGAPPNHNLMMTTTDEFRIKAEEYDVLQAAIPIHERFGPDSWQMQLRGGSTKICTIGHIFSGLECELKAERKPPKIIRRPRPVLDNGGLMTASGILGPTTESTASIMIRKNATDDEGYIMKAKKQRLKANLRKLRPHNVTLDLAEGLLITTTPLFEWAESSSRDYFDRLEDEERQEEYLAAMNSCNNGVKNMGLNVNVDPNRNLRALPTLTFNTSTEIVFNTVVGEVVFKVAKFTNTGTVALNYSWKVDPCKYPTSTGAAAPNSLRQVLLDRSKGLPTRESVLANQRASFFCQKDTGKILPGETVETCFSYCNKSGGGIINQSWLLDTVPRAVVKLVAGNSTSKSESGGSFSNAVDPKSPVPNQNYIETEAPLCVNFRGHTNQIDYDDTQRKYTSQNLDTFARNAYITDQLMRSVRRIRDPIRISTIRDRQRDLFSRINDDYLRSLCEQFGDKVPYFVTNERINSLIEFVLTSSNEINLLRNKLLTIVRDSSRFDSIKTTGRNEEIISMQEFEVQELVWMEQEEIEVQIALKNIQELLLPEKQLDIFDEVTMDDIIMKWDFNLSTLLQKCANHKARAFKYVDIEGALQIQLKEEEKARIKEQKRQAKLAKAKGKKKSKKVEDSDEEEEEEEEDEEDAATAALNAELKRLRHPEIVNATLLLNQCNSLIRLNFASPTSNICEPIAKASLIDCLDNMEEWDRKAREVAKLADGAVYTPFLSPFCSEEGEKQWQTCISNTYQPPVAAAPAKGAPKGEPVSNILQQTDTLYREMYNAVYAGILNAAVKMFDDVDTQLFETNKTETLESSSVLFDTSALRVEDIKASNRIVFVNFDGDAFTSSTARNGCNSTEGLRGLILSAFDEATNKQKVAVDPIYTAGVNGAHAIVAIYEDSNPDSSRSLLKSCSIISQLLNEREVKRKQAYDALSIRKKKRLAIPEVIQVQFDVLPCTSSAELKAVLQQFEQSNVYKGQSKGTTIVPVFVLENIQLPGVIAVEPDLEPYVSDDDEAPLNAFGEEEFKQRRKELWIAKRPHKVTVNVPVISSPAIAAVNLKRLSSVNSTLTVGVFAEPKAAVVELFNVVNKGIWIDASSSTLVLPRKGSLQNLNWKNDQERVLSPSIRELLLWCGVINYAPLIPTLPKEGVVHAHFNRLFSKSTNSVAVSNPKLLYVAGGKTRLEKFRMLDEMIYKADTLFIIGELAIPFIATANSGVKLNKYADQCAHYRNLCIQIIANARLRGVRVILPKDIVIGEEPLKSDDVFKCFDKVEKDARDEGGDYDEDTKTIVLENQVTVDGHVFDIGPETVLALKHEIEQSDMLIVWGTAGVCEISNFQAGQRALVGASAIKIQEEEVKVPVAAAPVAAPTPAVDAKGKPLPKGAAPVPEPVVVAAPKKKAFPAHTIVIGDASVEWYSRIMDPEGELNGNIQKAGIVSYCQRSSSLFTGCIGKYDIPFLKNLPSRSPVEEEFLYNKVEKVEEEEEEEEEPEDEDEEDEDEDD